MPHVVRVNLEFLGATMAEQQGGLLAFLNSPTGQGLLGAAGAALSGNGNARQNIGRGILGGVGAYGSAQDNALQADQRAYQQEQIKKQRQIDALAPQFLRSGTQNALGTGAAIGDQQGGFVEGQYQPPVKNVGPTVGNASALGVSKPSFDLAGYSQALMGIDPLKGVQLQTALAKDSPFDKVSPDKFTPDSVARFARSRNYGDLVPVRKMDFAPNGQVVDLYSATPGQSFSDPNKPFMTGGDGRPVANLPFQRFEIGKARAGKTDVNLAVNTEKSLLTTMGEGLGKQLDSSLAGAQSAAQTIGTAQQIRSLVDSGKVITGPGADYRLTLARIGDSLGIGGGDTAEKLSNTVQLMQGLAKTELDASQSMRGQGPITDSERALIRRAAAGDLNMTPRELSTLSGAIEKNARARIKQHQTQVNRLNQMPGATPIIPFYNVDEPPDAPISAPSQGGAWSIKPKGSK